MGPTRMTWLGVVALGLCGVAMWANAAIENNRSWGTLPYHGTLEQNGALYSGTVRFRFSLWDAATDGTLLWQEEQADVPVQAGAFAVRLGTQTPLHVTPNGSGPSVEGATDLFLQVAVQGPGDADFTALPGRQQLGPSTWALSAARALPGHGFNVDGALTVGGTVNVGGTVTAAAGFGYVPVGTIMAWHKNIAPGALTLPPGWVECNGGTINDAASPLNGLAIPDLNAASDGRGRFLRGGAQSGVMQEATAVWAPSERGGGTDMYLGAIPQSSPTATNDDGWENDAVPGRYGWNTSYDGANTRNDRVRVRPRNMSVVWIMRIY